MAETMKRDVSRAPAKEFPKMSSYRECVCAMLKLLADFGKELKLNDAALRIEVNVNALDLPSSPDAGVHASLQEHVTKLQAVSESLNSLINAAAQDGSSTDRTADPSTASTLLPNSEAAESKAVADDVMVQITARKSEVGPRRRLRQLFLQSETFPELASSARCQANE